MNSEYMDFVDDLINAHEIRLDEMLVKLEQDIARLADGAPLRDGELFDLAWAVNARQQIESSFDDMLLEVTEMYDQDFSEMDLLAYRGVSRIKEFTRLPNEVLLQLKRQKFTGFEEVANTFKDTLAKTMYQYTLVNGDKQDMIAELRGAINGVYQASDKEQIAELVEIAKGDGEEAEQARLKLRSEYGSDRLGNNLRRYANVYARDAVMEMSAELTIANANEAEIDRFRYDGSNIKDTREHCRKHKGKTYTRDEIYEIWEGDWQGKKAGDPFIVRGGWNCRHFWTPVV